MEGNKIVSGWPSPPGATAPPRIFESRRTFVVDALLSLAFASVAPWAVSRGRADSLPRRAPLAGNPSPSPASTEQSPAATGSGPVRSASDFSGRLTTAVRIDGRGPYRFMVDTGAERTFIADELATALALPRGRQVLVQGIIRGRPASLVHIQQLRMGSLVSSNLEVPTLPRAMLGADGYLGLDVLDGRRVIFDFRSGTLTVTKPQGFFSAFFTRGEYLRVPTLGESGRLRATDCVIDGVHAAAFFDTGAEVSIMNEALYAALQRHNPAQSRHAAAQIITGVTGGSVEGVTTLIDMITLGDLVLTFTPAVVVDLPVFAMWGLGRTPALLIGMDCLRRCARVSIDYRRKEVRFELAGMGLPAPLQAALPRPIAG